MAGLTLSTEKLSVAQYGSTQVFQGHWFNSLCWAWSDNRASSGDMRYSNPVVHHKSGPYKLDTYLWVGVIPRKHESLILAMVDERVSLIRCEPPLPQSSEWNDPSPSLQSPSSLANTLSLSWPHPSFWSFPLSGGKIELICRRDQCHHQMQSELGDCRPAKLQWKTHFACRKACIEQSLI